MGLGIVGVVIVGGVGLLDLVMECVGFLVSSVVGVCGGCLGLGVGRLVVLFGGGYGLL